MRHIEKPELLAPAGNLSKLKVAIDFGADAVYLGGTRLNLRANADNFSDEEILEGIRYAHQRDCKVYMTLNVIPHDEDMEGLEEYLVKIRDMGIDALIVADPGIIMTCRNVIPDMELHLSTQANNVNSKSAIFWHGNGVKRIVVARELTMDEIQNLISKIPDTLEIEAFVHGSMCMAYSGRCLLSNYMVGRDANRGQCAQPCRYRYYLVEEKRLDEPMELLEDEGGSYIMNSKDLCMIQHIPELMESGITSFKIEGRMKSEYYVGAIVKAYRTAIDKYLKDPEGYEYDTKWLELLEKVSHRKYHTGFYFGRDDSQIYDTATYVRDYDIVATVLKEEADERYYMLEKNRIYPDTEVEVLRAEGDVFKTTLREFMDEEGEPIDVANKAAMNFTCSSPNRLKAGDMIIQISGENKKTI